MRNLLPILIVMMIFFLSFSAQADERAKMGEMEAYDDGMQALRDGVTLDDGTKVQMIDDKWLVLISESALGDRSTVRVLLDSEHNASGSMIIQCKDNETDVGFTFGEYMGTDSVLFEYKIGDSPITKDKTLPAGSGKAFFVRKPILFLKKLVGERRLALRVAPYRSGNIERVYNVKALKKLLNLS